jgi:CRAL/TRIO domain
VYPHFYHKTDKKGRPIYIERLGQLKIDEVFKLTTEERLIKHYIQSYETLMRLRFPACSAIAGQRVEQGLNILDLNGGSMKILSKKVYALIQLATKVGSDYYPEIMGQTFIVSAPLLFSGVWAIIKGFLDEKTRKKISIKGGSYQKDLLEIVDADNLPDFLGGKCTLFGAHKDGVGPWNDYEIVEPVGIHKRQAIGSDGEETKDNHK